MRLPLRRLASFGHDSAALALQRLRTGAHPLPPALAANYRVGRFLGAGTFGDLFEAVRLPSSEDKWERMAVKVLPRDAVDGGQSFEMDYAPVLSDPASGPGAKRLRRYLPGAQWEDPRFYFLGMEWLGERVRTLNDALPDVRWADARDWLAAVLEALEHLHSRRAEHGDVHARNVLLVGRLDGEVEEARLADLGEGRIVEAGEKVGAADVADFLNMAARVAAAVAGSEAGPAIGDTGGQDAESAARAAIARLLVPARPTAESRGTLPTAAELRAVLEGEVPLKARL
ncbi:hypothetical protein DFJ74DRAFT_669504 [Hyaloraphidium curvatum]|nr:hypothetical protein DFJ74DRAFT_669504 [Hyaloraphidium curvatum]